MSKFHSWCAFSFVLLVSFTAFSGSLTAQNALSRISTVDRSDGKGAVIRYHFEQAIDSFEVIQPAPDLVQMVLYGDIDTTGIQMPGPGKKVEQVYLYELDYGFGVDIYLGEGYAYIADAYPDQNHRHLLVALTETSYDELDAYSQQFIARNWYDEGEIEVPEITLPPVNTTPEVISDLYKPIRNKLRFDKIVIDAGHGGHDPGNLGYKNGAKEKDVVLAIAKKLGEYINEGLPEVEVIYTREGDEFIALDERGSIANRAEADLFISIHADAWYQASVRGASVFFLGLDKNNRSFEAMKEENQVYSDHGLIENLSEEDLIIYELAHSGNIANSERIAYMVEDQIKNRAQRKSRGVKTKGLAVLYQSTMPAILVETGFLTNPAEQRYLTSNRGQAYIASAIYRAIKQYKKEQDASQSLQANSAND